MSKNGWFKHHDFLRFNAFRKFELFFSSNRDLIDPPDIDLKNWHKEGAVPPSRDQGNCMTCSSFAITAVLETLHYIKFKKSINLSPGFIHTCLLQRDCDSGAGVEKALGLIARHGVALGFDNDYPFPQNKCNTKNLYQILDTARLPGPNSAMKAILNEGPIIGEMKIDSRFAGVGPDDIYDFQGPTLTTHAVAVIGYDLPNKFWIIMNSAGPSWGKAGIGKVAFGSGGLLTKENKGFQIFIS